MRNKNETGTQRTRKGKAKHQRQLWQQPRNQACQTEKAQTTMCLASWTLPIWKQLVAMQMLMLMWGNGSTAQLAQASLVLRHPWAQLFLLSLILNNCTLAMLPRRLPRLWRQFPSKRAGRR